MRRRWLGAMAALALSALAIDARANVVLECGAWAGAEYLIEPWEETSRTFSRGSIRVAVVDLGEPPCCPQHIVVLMPANMYGGRSCALIAKNVLAPNGWAKVDIDAATADRPSGGGLRVSVPVFNYDYRTGGADPDSRQVIRFRARQAAGTVTLETEE